MPDGGGDVAIQDGVIEVIASIGGDSQDGGWEDDLVIQWVVVSVHGIRTHPPLFPLGRTTDAGIGSPGLPLVHR